MVKKCKITPELTAKARENVKLGFSYSMLAASLNISDDTLYYWFRKARESGAEPYKSFYDAV
jgi:transposase-like protein